MPEIGIQTEPMTMCPAPVQCVHPAPVQCGCSQEPLWENCGPNCRFESYKEIGLRQWTPDEIIESMSFNDFFKSEEEEEMINDYEEMSGDEIIQNIDFDDFDDSVDEIIMNVSFNDFDASHTEIVDDTVIIQNHVSQSSINDSADEIMFELSIRDFVEWETDIIDDTVMLENQPEYQSPPCDLDDSYYMDESMGNMGHPIASSSPIQSNPITELAAAIVRAIDAPETIDLVTPPPEPNHVFIDLVSQGNSDNEDLDSTLHNVESMRGATQIVDQLINNEFRAPIAAKKMVGKSINRQLVHEEQIRPIIAIYSPSQSEIQIPPPPQPKLKQNKILPTMLRTQEFNRMLNPTTSRIPPPQQPPQPQKVVSVPRDKKHLNKRTNRYENTQEKTTREEKNRLRREAYRKRTGAQPRRPRQINRNKEDGWTVPITVGEIFGQLLSSDESD